MRETRPNGSAIRFGVFELDAHAGELRKQGIRIKLQDQPFQVLQILLERPGEVVTREELQQRIWPPDTFVDFDHGLHNAIKKLRQALGDSAETPRYIVTLPKRGYRFIVPVNGNGGGAQVRSLDAPLVASANQARLWRPQTLAVILLAVSAATVLLVAVVPNTASGKLARWLGRGDSRPIHSLAVLPLQNLSGDPAQEYFSDGMTDALITELSRVGAFKVISRTSVMRYKKTAESLPQIAKELNVDGLVEGTVQRTGDRVRVTAQLIYGPSDEHIWANSYERDVQDALALEGDVAKAITQEIRVQLTPQEQRQYPNHRPASVKALEAYLQGQYHRESLAWPMLEVSGLDREYREELEKALEYFHIAVKEDPSYARAYVAMAEVYAWDESINGDESANADGIRQARIALGKALSLDPLLAGAHTNVGELAFKVDWDWPTAERELKRAIQLDPNLAHAHEVYAEYLDARGRLDEGMKEFELLQELDPGNQSLPDAFYHRRQFDRVIDLRRVNVARHAYGPSAHFDLAYAYERSGMYKEATDEWIETMVELRFDDLAEDLRRGYARAGFRGAIREWVAGLEKMKDGPYVPPTLPAYLYAILGEKNQAFAWLQKAYAARDGNMPFLKVDPDWDDLRSDPRFDDLVRRVGLPP